MIHTGGTQHTILQCQQAFDLPRSDLSGGKSSEGRIDHMQVDESNEVLERLLLGKRVFDPPLHHRPESFIEVFDRSCDHPSSDIVFKDLMLAIDFPRLSLGLCSQREHAPNPKTVFDFGVPFPTVLTKQGLGHDATSSSLLSQPQATFGGTHVVPARFSRSCQRHSTLLAVT
ncbi:MAG: hypothetical protein WCG85_19700 [Polyangia bacterium]